MKRGLLAIIAISLFASCADDRSASVADIVSQWEGREILFPENSVFTIQGRDTVDFQFQDAPYKILTYVDSVGCMSCKLHLPIWEKYIHRIDSITEGKVPIVFYMHAKEYKELSFITQRDQFFHPICFDELDKLNQLNNFPSCIMYHTFLLNKENIILAIGNPILDFRIRDIYNKILNEGDITKTFPKTSVNIDSSIINLGTTNKGQKTYNFVLTNNGVSDLYIKEIIPSCDCMTVSYDDGPISQGNNTFINVSFNAGLKGEFNEMLSVYANIEDSPIELYITGSVE